MTTTEIAPSLARARSRQHRAGLVLVLLAVLTGLCFLIGAGYGAVAIGPGQIVSILFDAVGLPAIWEYTTRESSVLMAIRLPRAILAVVVGAGLAISGAVLQGLFRNPLADPGLIGVSTGAALAAVLVIVLGGGVTMMLPEFLRPLMLPVSAFLGGLLVTLLIYRLAARNGYTDVATMLLAGVAINAIAGAVIGLMVFISNDQQLRDLNFWMLGSLGGVTWKHMLPALPFIILPTIGLLTMGRQLNAMLLGEREAYHLGFDVERTKMLIIIGVALVTGAAVSITGVIGFVGLVVPHLVRLAIGPDHRILMPASIFLGSALLLIADLGARTLALPAELPIGILTSCIGGPFFIWLLTRRRGRGIF